ncbi:hypothetical protein PG913_08640 [Tenacibaculum pacificus]|uniref:hypothetical protein n=1 Tax=Tenacibaculum pacificus TaxID=3018314 RepID=UPI0022F3B774|nr:hypothetical protein [Tenacibaculum pacificus]WBX72963.1 hypothetical protein PG913_08640 [Tenacibaculum pacificus]
MSFFLFSKCEYPDTFYGLSIRNNSDIPISFYLNTIYKTKNFQYPDTLINNSDITRNIGLSTATVNSSKSWREIVSDLPKDTLSIFIFDKDIIKKEDWEKVRKDYLILKRYDLSIEDLELLNYKIPYPPTAEMFKMKQYPSFD